MKKVILLTAVMVLSASLAFGQTGVIGTYADAAGANCNVTDGAVGLLSIFIVHNLHAGATGAQFRAAAPACMVTTGGATYLSDTAVFAVNIGNSQTGIAIGYGTCQLEPTHILSMSFFAAGATQLCCAYTVDADPLVGQVQVTDCAFNTLPAAGRVNTVNGNAIQCDCNVVPVEETTWGRVKTLYSE